MELNLEGLHAAPGAQSVGAIYSSSKGGEKKSFAEQVASKLGTIKKEEGWTEKSLDLGAWLEEKKALKVERKANEVIHTTNTGFGAELIPQAVQIADLLDLMPAFSPILQWTRGFRGRGLAKLNELPVAGRLAKHQLGAEWTTGSPTAQIAQGIAKLPTAKVSLNAKRLYLSVDISDEEVRFASNVGDLMQIITAKLGRSGAETLESMAINGDTQTGTTNINANGAAIGTVSHVLANDGLRKTAIANSKTFSVGTMAFDSYISTLKLLSLFGAKPADVAVLFNYETYLKSAGLAEFKSQADNGKAASSLYGMDALGVILGSPILASSEMALADATGKQDGVTPGNNTKGSFLAVHRDAIQYGFNGDYAIEIFRVPGVGYQVLGYYYAAVGIATPTAGENGSLVAYGINATV